MTDTRSAAYGGSSRPSLYGGYAWSWSPQGGSIAIEWPAGDRTGDGSGLDIVVIDVRSGTRRILTSGCQPAWSPDGKRIAFVEQIPAGDGSRGVAVIGVDGRGLHELVRSRGSTDYAPSWSPDGSTIAFNRAAAGTSLEVVKADGSGLRRLGTVRDDSLTRPQWSRDGHAILWSSTLGGSFVAVVPVTGRARPVTPIPGTRGAQDADWLG